uniref:SFRICE_012559 n=1 Tax=Spodoptera frugiperda TaxID=7108 RepID=A0A2H1VLB4_SPOFR
MSAKRRPPVLLKPNRASKIIALVPNENAPSDASEISDSETELHDARTNSSTPLSSPAPSIASSLANLTIDTSDDEELNSEDTDIIPDSIVREIGNSIYENVPSLSAIPSLPATPITPIASSLVPRKTRSRKPPTVKAKRPKKAKKFQLTYNWRVAQFRHQATIEEGEDDNYIDLPEDDSPLNIMSLKRYQLIRRYLHFVDNTMDDGDKYFKVRPVVEQIRQNCLKQQKKETKFSIDEMMIAYKGTKAELLFILRENYGVFALGTIRGNRLRGAEKVLPTEKAMRKKPRGHFVEANSGHMNEFPIVDV